MFMCVCYPLAFLKTVFPTSSILELQAKNGELSLSLC